MKHNKVLKSLEELSLELLAPEAAKTAETTPGPFGLVTAETKSDQGLQPSRFLTDTKHASIPGLGN